MKFFIVAMLFSVGAIADTWVNGYHRSNGTYVEGHMRSDRNSTVDDNFSEYPNTNPYTGKQGTKRSYRNGYGN